MDAAKGCGAIRTTGRAWQPAGHRCHGDERNALIMYLISIEGGPIGSKVFPSAQTWLLDDEGKIKVERIASYMAPG
jgi:hypothetical protein